MTAQNKGIAGATLEGVKGRLQKKQKGLAPSISVEGQDCLVTGANAGLGKGIATHLAARGGRILMAGRTLDDGARQDIVRASGNRSVKMEQLDLASFDSVLDFVDRLQSARRTFSVLVLNAAVITKKSSPTVDHLEEMIQVNFLSNVLLVEALLKAGLLVSQTPKRPPRIVVVSSEAHRWSEHVDLDTLGASMPFSMKQSMGHYSDSKFLMASYVAHLARRLNGIDGPKVTVLALCPGAVNSKLARQAPAFLKPLLKTIFGLFFASPSQAAQPVVRLAASPSFDRSTGLYHHIWKEKPMDPRAEDVDFGQQVFERAVAVVNERTGRQIL